MRTTIRTLTVTAAGALFVFSGAAQAQTEIDWWHAMGGELGAKLEEIAADFNDSQTDYKVVPGLQGHLSRDDDRRRSPLSAPSEQPAHRPGVRGRHRHHDGRQGRRSIRSTS